MAKDICWKHGDNGYQNFYDARVNGDYLLVYENRWSPGVWLGCIERKREGMRNICDKAYNDRQRKRQGLERGCDISELKSVKLLSHSTPEYMIRKVEHCYRRNKIEVCP